MFNLAALFTPAVYRRTLTISGNVSDWDLVDDGLSGNTPTQRSIITINIASGANVAASSTSVPAMDLRGLPDDSQIIINNLGEVWGAGGNGGAGATLIVVDEVPFNCQTQNTPTAGDGSDGGDAILYDGTGVDLDIYNASGKIWAGGGGGGGSNGAKVSSPCSVAGGGGGGGGAGGFTGGGLAGTGGSGGSATIDGVPTGGAGSDGGDGTKDSSGSGGSGGSGGTDGSATGGNGGAGGGFGAAGTASNGAAGAAGLAVNNDGTGTTTFQSGGTPGSDVKGTVE